MKKKPNSVGYFSAYYRGLEVLLKLWPAIRKEVPDATLDVFYGWESWLAIQGEDDFYQRMEQKFEDVKDQGVTVHGRVGHKELIKRMQETQVWAYSTEFAEIFCITAIKANASHCKPVITEVAALKETGGPVATRIKTRRLYYDEYSQKKFIEAIVDGLRNPLTKAEIGAQDSFTDKFDWSKIAEQWSRAIK